MKKSISIKEMTSYIEESEVTLAWNKHMKASPHLTNKEIAKALGVTESTISNLNTDSKFSLIYDIAEIIYWNYDLYTEENGILNAYDVIKLMMNFAE